MCWACCVSHPTNNQIINNDFGQFPPLPVPMLQPNELIFLVDMSYDGAGCMPFALTGDAAEESFFWEISLCGRGLYRKNTSTYDPIICNLVTSNWSWMKMASSFWRDQVFDVRFFFILLSEFKVICLHKSSNVYIWYSDVQRMSLRDGIDSEHRRPMGSLSPRQHCYFADLSRYFWIVDWNRWY